jgi:hypothetical protein
MKRVSQPHIKMSTYRVNYKSTQMGGHPIGAMHPSQYILPGRVFVVFFFVLTRDCRRDEEYIMNTLEII